MKKFVDIDELVRSLRNAGMEAGVGLEGSSYPLVKLAGGAGK